MVKGRFSTFAAREGEGFSQCTLYRFGENYGTPARINLAKCGDLTFGVNSHLGSNDMDFLLDKRGVPWEIAWKSNSVNTRCENIEPNIYRETIEKLFAGRVDGTQINLQMLRNEVWIYRTERPQF